MTEPPVQQGASFDRDDTILPELWASHARARPNHPALVCGGERLTWCAFNARMNRLANALASSGVRKGDRVAVLASSSIAACVAMFGTVKSGAAMVPVSSMLTAEQVGTILRDCGARHILCSADLRHLVDGPEAASRDVWRIGTNFEDADWIALDRFCAEAGDHEPEVRLSGDDAFSVMYSSGTTGAPKGVEHRHSARTYFSLSNALELRFDSAARGLVTTALYTAGTWLIVLPTLSVGGTLHIHNRYDPRRYMAALAAEAITHTFAVPSQLRALLADGLLTDRPLPELRVLLAAGSPLRTEEKAQLIGRIGARFYELYGFTEGSSTLLTPADQGRKPGSVGRPLMGQEILTVDADGRPCATDEIGEVVGRGPGLLSAYLGRPEATRDAMWRDARGRSFVRSGDLGRLDDEGFLYIVDRKKDMIISGGLNVYPADIEGIIADHPDVADVCVIGTDHAKWGEAPLGLVVLSSGAGVSAQELLDWTNVRLAKHQRLCALHLRTSLPRNALGKVLKRDLRVEYAAAAEPGPLPTDA